MRHRAGRRRFLARPERPLDHVFDVAVVVGTQLALAAVPDGWWTRLWSALGGDRPAGAVVVALAFGWYLAVFWSWGLLSLALDRARPAWTRTLRLQRPIGGNDRHDALDAVDDAVEDVRGDDVADVDVASAVRLVLVNQFAVTLPMLALVAPVFFARGLDVAGPPPPGWQAVLLVVAAFLWVEVSFYVVHRAMHRPRAFRAFHHVHHRYRRPTGIATHYAHPVDHLLGNLVPVLGGAVIVAVHPTTLLLWITLAVRNAIVTHGNVALPLLGAPAHHDFHHHDPRGNFGVVGLLDRLFGTDARYRAAVAAPAGVDDEQVGTRSVVTRRG